MLELINIEGTKKGSFLLAMSEKNADQKVQISLQHTYSAGVYYLATSAKPRQSCFAVLSIDDGGFHFVSVTAGISG
jgi:hypothetical protein